MGESDKLEQKRKLVSKQEKQMDKIKKLAQKIFEYEQSDLAKTTSLNLSWDERDTIKRALACHLECLRTERNKNRNSVANAAKEEGG